MPTTRIPYGVLDGRYINAEGDSMLGALTLSGAPSVDLHAATKKYVDDGLVLKADDADVLKKDGSVALTADWDIGDSRMIEADKIQARDAAGLCLYEDGGAGICIEDGGNVGIGTTGMTYKFEVVDSTAAFRCPKTQYTAEASLYSSNQDAYFVCETDRTNGIAAFQLKNDAQTWTIGVRGDVGDSVVFRIGAVNYVVYTTGGNVGIATTGPDRKLDVLDASNPQLRLTHTDGSVYADFQAESDGDLSIEPSGSNINIIDKNLLLGTTTGTQIGTAANQKFALWGATPIVQLAKADYNNWAAMSDLLDALAAFGLIDSA